MTLRTQKAARTRDALFDAAVELFVERGYDATTMDEIAERAVVSRATAFKYFPKKDDLLTEWAVRRQAVVAAQSMQRKSEPGRPARIKQMIMDLARPYTHDKAGRTFVQAWLSTGGPLKPEAWVSAHLLGNLVREEQASGAIRADADPQLAGRLLLNMFLGALYQWTAQRKSAAWLRHELDAALDVILDGLAVPARTGTRTGRLAGDGESPLGGSQRHRRQSGQQ